MNRIEAGKVYTAVRQRSGSSASGDWELLATQDERGNNDIAVFVVNTPSNVKEGGKFRIEKQYCVWYDHKKMNGTYPESVR